MDFKTRLQNAGSSAPTDRLPKIAEGTHRLALVKGFLKNTQNLGAEARIFTFQVLESSTMTPGTRVSTAYYVNNPDPVKADKQISNYKKLLIAIGNTTDSSALGELDSQLVAPEQFGTGVQVIATGSAMTFPVPHVKLDWQPVTQTPEQLIETRKMLESSAPAAPAPAAPSLLGGLLRR